MTAVLIGAGVVAGIKLLMDWWGRRKGGLVIDLRPDAKDLFYRDDALDYEYVVTLPADGGKVTVEVKDNPDAATTWINKVIEGGFEELHGSRDGGEEGCRRGQGRDGRALTLTPRS